MYWIVLGQDRDRSQVYVKVVMNHKMWGISALAEVLLASQEGLWWSKKVWLLSTFLKRNFIRPVSHLLMYVY
jgi:hypothetical protein